MSIENVQRIATFFRLPAEPAPVQVEGNVWKVHQEAAEHAPADPLLAVNLAIVALGASPSEALAAYQRQLVLLAATHIDAVRNARARANAFVLAADEVDAAIGAEMAPPTP